MIEVELPDGRILEIEAGDDRAAARAAKAFLDKERGVAAPRAGGAGLIGFTPSSFMSLPEAEPPPQRPAPDLPLPPQPDPMARQIEEYQGPQAEQTPLSLRGTRIDQGISRLGFVPDRGHELLAETARPLQMDSPESFGGQRITYDEATGLERAGDQLRSGWETFKQGLAATRAKSMMEALALADRADGGASPVEAPLWAELSPEQRQGLRDRTERALGSAIQSFITSRADQQEFLRNPNVQALAEAVDSGRYRDAWRILSSDFGGIVQQASVESLPSQIPGLVGALAGGVVARAPGMLTGQFLGGYAADVGPRFVEALSKRMASEGVDGEDGAAVETWLRGNMGAMREEFQAAQRGGFGPALADTASLGLARGLRPGAGVFRNTMTGLRNMGIEIGTEGAGEAAAGIFAEGKVTPSEVLMEMLGAGPQAVGTTAIATLQEARSMGRTGAQAIEPVPNMTTAGAPRPTAAQMADEAISQVASVAAPGSTTTINVGGQVRTMTPVPGSAGGTGAAAVPPAAPPSGEPPPPPGAADPLGTPPGGAAVPIVTPDNTRPSLEQALNTPAPTPEQLDQQQAQEEAQSEADRAAGVQRIAGSLPLGWTVDDEDQIIQVYDPNGMPVMTLVRPPATEQDFAALMTGIAAQNQEGVADGSYPQPNDVPPAPDAPPSAPAEAQPGAKPLPPLSQWQIDNEASMRDTLDRAPAIAQRIRDLHGQGKVAKEIADLLGWTAADVRTARDILGLQPLGPSTMGLVSTIPQEQAPTPKPQAPAPPSAPVAPEAPTQASTKDTFQAGDTTYTVTISPPGTVKDSPNALDATKWRVTFTGKAGSVVTPMQVRRFNTEAEAAAFAADYKARRTGAAPPDEPQAPAPQSEPEPPQKGPEAAWARYETERGGRMADEPELRAAQRQSFILGYRTRAVGAENAKFDALPGSNEADKALALFQRMGRRGRDLSLVDFQAGRDAGGEVYSASPATSQPPAASVTTPAPTPGNPTDSGEGNVTTPAPDVTTPAPASDLEARKAAAKAKFAAAIKASSQNLNAGIDPSVLAAGIELGLIYIEEGVVKFRAWARAVLADAVEMGLDPEAVKPTLKPIYLATSAEVADDVADQMDERAAVRAFDFSTLDQPEAPAVAPTAAPARVVAEREPAIADADRRATIFTPSGIPIEVTYELRDVSALVVSNDDNGRPNPDYPQELQPRDRTRAASMAQVASMAQGLNPALLGENPSTADGAPVVSPEGVVESGNGRTMALRRAYAEDMPSAQAYREWLEDQGYDTADMQAPVLVRVRQTKMDDAARAEYTRASNERTTLAMSPVERAAADAQALGSAIEKFRGGSVTSAENRPFVVAFMNEAVAKADRAAMMDGDGAITQDGRRRIEAALLQAAYRDGALVAEVFEAGDSDIKAIGGALLDVAGTWALMRREADSGFIAPGVDITPDLLAAVSIVRRARDSGTRIATLIGQASIFEAQASPLTLGFLATMFRDTEYTKPRGRDAVATILLDYAEQARKSQPGVNLLGDPEIGGAQILRIINERIKRRDEEARSRKGGGPDLFGGGTDAGDGNAPPGPSGGRPPSGPAGAGPSDGARTQSNEVGEGDASNTLGNLESGGGQSAAQSVLAGSDGSPTGGNGGGRGAGGRAGGTLDAGQPGDSGSSVGSPPSGGERGDFGFSDGNPAGSLEGVTTGGNFDERGDLLSLDGVSPGAAAGGAVAPSPSGNLSRDQALAAQRAAESLALEPGITNIRATLPVLLPGQQEDVAKTEDRFAKPDGYGMLFTNGTGTGKTYTGLGVIKRFQRQGKTNILIVAPDEKVGSDWANSGNDLALKITRLADTKDAGKGIVVTTYANLGQNDALASRSWDLVVADEAHNLMKSGDASVTNALSALRALTLHPDGALALHDMENREAVDEVSALAEELRILRKQVSVAGDRTGQLASRIGQVEAKLDPLTTRLAASRAAVKRRVTESQGAARPRAMFLSATPFAYEKNIEWAQGYLFEYGPEPESGGYNTPSAQQRFMIEHFGYSMKYGKLTEPGPLVDRGLMQREFNTWLRREGSLSARSLDVPADYDRRFILIDSRIGNRVDEALSWVSDKSRGDDSKSAHWWGTLRAAIDEQFNYLARMYFLEAIKTEASIPIVQKHLDMGRKVIVFHDFKGGGGFNPFDIDEKRFVGSAVGDHADRARLVLGQFRTEFADLIGAAFSNMEAPVRAYRKAFGDKALIVNGDEKQRDNLARYAKFQDDASGPVVLLVQSAKNAGWSGHDTTGKYQRVILNLGLPVAPTTAIQQEGRAYRTGQASNAIMRYMNTGTNWEKFAFASKISARASTAENLGMGEDARALKDAFIGAFEASDNFEPGHEGEGMGGKEADRLSNASPTPFGRAKAYYFGQQKKNSRTKSQEGNDYFATPEPLGQRMVAWADARGGNAVLEPSAGHGAIARWFGDNLARTAIEPSNALRARLAMVMSPESDRLLSSTFEDLNIVNKYDVIVMNPPFGVGGKMAIEHLAKAANHLRDGGRIVALIPTGPAADKRFDQWLYAQDDKGRSTNPDIHFVADIRLPTSTFERAGTSVATRIVIIDKQSDKAAAGRIGTTKTVDISDASNVTALFDRIENMEMPVRQLAAPAARTPAPPAYGAPITPPANGVRAPAQETAGTVDRGDEPIIEHTTQSGKVLRGIVRKGITRAQARALDIYTFSKDGGFFIREKHLKPPSPATGDADLSLSAPSGWDNVGDGPAIEPITPDAMRALLAVLRTLAGDQAALEISGSGVGNASGAAVGPLVRLAYSIGKERAEWVVRHEAIHTLRNLGKITEAEWTILTDAAKREGWAERFDIEERYRKAYAGRLGPDRKTTDGRTLEEMIAEEAVAETFAQWATGNAPQTSGPVARIFQKIQQFLIRLRNAMRGRGFQDERDIFEAITRGELGARPVRRNPRIPGGVSAARRSLNRVYGGDMVLDADAPQGDIPAWLGDRPEDIMPLYANPFDPALFMRLFGRPAARAVRAAAAGMRERNVKAVKANWANTRLPDGVEVEQDAQSRDLLPLWSVLQRPSRMFRKWPAVAALVDQGIAAERRMNNWQTRMNGRMELILRTLEKQKGDRAKVAAALFDADANEIDIARKDVADKHFAAHDLSPAEATAARELNALVRMSARLVDNHRRAMTPKVRQRKAEIWNSMTAMMDRAAVKSPEYQKMYARRGRLNAKIRNNIGDLAAHAAEIESINAQLRMMRAADPVIQNRMAELQTEYDALESRLANTSVQRRVGYFPHKFFGSWRMFKIEGVDEETGEQIRTEITSDQGFYDTEEQAVEAARAYLKANPDAKLRIERKVSLLPSGAGGAVLSDAGYSRLRRGMEEQTGIEGQELSDMLSGVARRRSRRRVFAPGMFRTGAEGFSEDIQRVLKTHISQSVRYVEMDKLKFAYVATTERLGLSPSRAQAIKTEGKAELLRALESWWTDVNGNKQQSEAVVDGLLNKLGLPGSTLAAFAGGAVVMGASNPILAGAFGGYLGFRMYNAIRKGGDFPTRTLMGDLTSDMAHLKLGMLVNIASSVVNLSQTLINTYPVLGEKWTAIGIKRALPAMLSQARNRDKPGMMSADAILLRRADVMTDISIQADAAPLLAEDAGLVKGIKRASMAPFMAAEHFNRAAAFLGALARAEAKGLSPAAAFQEAQAVLKKTQFHQGIADRPELLRVTVLKLPTQFKNFMIQQIGFAFDLAGDTFKNPAPVARFLLGLFLAAGMIGLLPLALADWLLDYGFGVSPIRWMKDRAIRAEIMGDMSGTMADFLMRGLPTLLQMDLSGRVGMGQGFIPNSPADLMQGPFIGTAGRLKDLASNNRQEIVDYLAALSPAANPLRMLEAAANGATIDSAKFWSGDNFQDGKSLVRNPQMRGMPEFNMTDRELITQGLGFRNLRQSLVADDREIARANRKEGRKDANAYLQEMVQAERNGRPERIPEIRQEAAQNGVTIPPQRVRDALRDARRDRPERDLRNAPRDMRPEMRERLRGIDSREMGPPLAR